MTARSTYGESRNLAVDDDSGHILHEEIGRLPERFRSAVVLCYLEGLTHEMAAGQLGCPVGTVRSRLATARERLRKRLTRRGLAPAALPVGLSGSALTRTSDSAALSTSLPMALVDTTVRGALRVGTGNGALAGIVSVEAVTLMEGVLTTMMTTKLTLLTTTILVAALVTTGAGVAAYSALGPGHGPAEAPTRLQKSDSNPPLARPTAPTAFGPPSAEVKQVMLRRSEESVKALLRDYESELEASRIVVQKAKTPEERRALQPQRRANPASYAGALLYEAEMNPATAPAEEALIWIVTHLPHSSMTERAKEMISRDHARSEKIEPLFRHMQILMPGSQAIERLFREALAKSPHRKIQGLACYYLARFLDYQASFVRLNRLFDPAQLENAGSPIQKETWGQDYNERLNKLNPATLEREAASLYERVVKEFGDLPLPHPQPNFTDDLLLPGPPTTFGAAARLYLHELKDLGVGKPAPEIEGTDVDGRPMKLSDYRGRVVAIYFCMPNQLRADGTGRPAMITESVRGVAERHANDPFALLGVSTVSPGRTSDREAFKSSLKASALPARFWWDISQDDKPGPIQTAWNARIDVYVLDRHGAIRYKRVLHPELFEKAVATLLKEQKDQIGRPQKTD